MTIIVTSWSDFCKELDQAPKRLKRKALDRWLLSQLERRPKKRFSIFEIGESMRVAKAMTRLCRQGFIETIEDPHSIFPWTYYKVHSCRTKPRPEKPIRTQTPAVLFFIDEACDEPG